MKLILRGLNFNDAVPLFNSFYGLISSLETATYKHTEKKEREKKIKRISDTEAHWKWVKM